ncbi:MAG TPA: ATP-binding protein [Burkholderiaceae bacterium]|nr:ATP-binding protein [Burkholderiaceae bacterium]
MQLHKYLRISLFWRTFISLVLLQLVSLLIGMVAYSNINPNWDFIALNRADWLFWFAIAVSPAMLGALAISSVINKPLEQLSKATNRVKAGDFSGIRLDGRGKINEIQNVYRGFNQMADQLSKIETNRTVMLAGISHDIRTPLARLRLETELSIADIDARNGMASDIEQINNIIGKFLDYARPNFVNFDMVNLAAIVAKASAAALSKSSELDDLYIDQQVPEDIQVLADPIELQRVLANLIENARRYGKAEVEMSEYSDMMVRQQHQQQQQTYRPELTDNDWSPTLIFESGVEMTHVKITAKKDQDWILLGIRDHGEGVPPNVLHELTTPFFRANNARSDVTGSGLGLAIVAKTVQSMGGELKFSNIDSRTESKLSQTAGILKPYSGFLVEIRLKSASSL